MRIGSLNRLTLPPDIMEALGTAEGDYVGFKVEEDGGVRIVTGKWVRSPPDRPKRRRKET